MKVILISAIIIFIPLAIFLLIVTHSFRLGVGGAAFIVCFLALVSLLSVYHEVKPMTAQLVVRMGQRTDRVLTEGPDASLIPLIEGTEEVSLKVRKTEVPPTDHFSKNGVNFIIEGIILWKPDVKNLKAFLEIQEDAVIGFLQGAFKNTMREFIGSKSQKELLKNRTQQIDQAKQIVQEKLTDKMSTFGIEIVDIEIPDIDLSQAMQKAREQRSIEKFEQKSEATEAGTIAQQAKQIADILELDSQQALEMIMEWRSMKELAGSGDLGILWDRVSRKRRRRKK